MMPNIDRDDENATRYEMPKPDIDEQIARQRYKVMGANARGDIADAAKEESILATLEAHKRIIEAADVPKPVAWIKEWDAASGSHCVSLNWSPHEPDGRTQRPLLNYAAKPLYGPDLLDAYHKALADRDAKEKLIIDYEEWLSVQGEGAAEAVKRAEDAERQLAECRKECEEQARLNGMGSEREARLMAQLSELREKHERLVARLREPSDEMLDAGSDAGDFHIMYYDGTDKPGTPRYSLRKSWEAMSTVALRDSEGGE